MRSEKDPSSGGREKSVVEIQFRDIPREQDGVSVNSRLKEEKKEVFTKVKRGVLVLVLAGRSRCAQTWRLRSVQHHGQRAAGPHHISLRDPTSSLHLTHYCVFVPTIC